MSKCGSLSELGAVLIMAGAIFGAGMDARAQADAPDISRALA